MSKKGRLGGLITGLAIGSFLGVLFAPQSGDKTRKELMKKINEIKDNLNEVDKEEVKEKILVKVEDIKNQIKELDKEKAVKLVKERIDNLDKDIDSLVKCIKKEGTPVLENITNELRKEATKVTKATLKKLEGK